nr:hypothetical protein [Tanacetum cinerariifolium]
QWHLSAPHLPQDIHRPIINSGPRLIQEIKLLFRTVGSQCRMCRGDRLRVMHVVEQREKILLAQAQEARVILGEEQLAFLADTWERVDSGLVTQALTTIAVFQIDDLDAFDLNCDKAPSASAVLMDKLSAYDSDVLYEVTNYNTYQDNNMIDQCVQ